MSIDVAAASFCADMMSGEVARLTGLGVTPVQLAVNKMSRVTIGGFVHNELEFSKTSFDFTKVDRLMLSAPVAFPARKCVGPVFSCLRLRPCTVTRGGGRAPLAPASPPPRGTSPSLPCPPRGWKFVHLVLQASPSPVFLLAPYLWDDATAGGLGRHFSFVNARGARALHEVKVFEDVAAAGGDDEAAGASGGPQVVGEAGAGAAPTALS
jgi:hypothetical protein